MTTRFGKQIAVVLISLFAITLNGSIIKSGRMNNTYINTPMIFISQYDSNEIAVGIIKFMENENVNITNHIAVVRKTRGDPINQVLGLQKRGAIGVLLIDSSGFLGAWETKESFVPVGVLSVNDANLFKQLVIEEGEVIIHLIPDTNFWLESITNKTAVTSWSVICSVLAVVCVLFASWKFSMFVMEYGLDFGSVAQLCLMIEIVSNTRQSILVLIHSLICWSLLFYKVRLIYCAWDPLFAYGKITMLEGNILLTISFPFGFASTLLITFYWQQVLNNSKMEVIKNLHKMKIAFIIIVIALFVIEITTSVLRVASVSSAFNAITTVALSIVFFVHGYRILRALKRMGSAVSEKKRAVEKTTKTIMLSGFLNFGFIIGLFLSATPLLWKPWGLYSIWLLIYVSRFFVSLCQIHAFRIEKRPKSNSSSKRSTQGSNELVLSPNFSTPTTNEKDLTDTSDEVSESEEKTNSLPVDTPSIITLNSQHSDSSVRTN